MYKRPSKKQLLMQRVIVLSVMFVSICIIVVATMLSILGYRLDGLNGRLEQGALVQFESVPAGARVSVDDQYINDTPTKRSLLAGDRTFMLERDGYRPWTKTITLEAGTLLWLDYVRLIPQNLQRTVISEYDTVTAMKTSANLRSIALKNAAYEPQFTYVDIRNREVSAESITIPTALYTTASSRDTIRSFVLHEWDANGRYILVEHRIGDTSEWLVIDVEDVGRSVNITRLLDIELSDIQFAGTSGNVFFALTNGAVRKLDLANATISRSVIQNVSSFQVYDTNIVSYVGADPEDRSKRVAGLYRDGDREPVIVYRSQNESPRLSIDTSRYFNDRYIAIADNTVVTVYRGDLPASEADVENLAVIETIPTTGTVTNLSFSPSGNHLVAQSGPTFIGYEVEYDRVHEASIASTEETFRALRWLDGALLWAVQDGMLSFREFDGANFNSIMPAVAGFDVTLSQNGRYLYAITKTDDSFRLERVTLILE